MAQAKIIISSLIQARQHPGFLDSVAVSAGKGNPALQFLIDVASGIGYSGQGSPAGLSSRLRAELALFRPE
jgi:hypothetical protein